MKLLKQHKHAEKNTQEQCGTDELKFNGRPMRRPVKSQIYTEDQTLGGLYNHLLVHQCLRWEYKYVDAT